MPLGQLTENNFQYDTQRKILTIVVPDPRLDEEVVEVQTQPSKIDEKIDAGWASTRAGEGAFVRKQIMERMRSTVIETGKSPASIALAEKQGRKVLTDLFDLALGWALESGVKVDVKYASEAAPTKTK